MPFASHAQQPTKQARIVYLGFGTPEGGGYLWEAFKQRMRELGYVEGKNVMFDIRWAMGIAERMPSVANELVALKPDVILAPGGPQALAAQRATATIPIVFATVSDPVGRGLVKSLARPGGNITGLSSLATDASPKLLELVRTVVPKVSRVAILKSRDSPAADLKNLQTAAQKVGVDSLVFDAQTEAEIENAFVRMTLERARAVIVLSSSAFSGHRRQIAELTIKNRIPSVFVSRSFAEDGGLISYGSDYADQVRRAAIFVDKILKGAKPSDLPVEQATKLELVINLKTAKAIGVTIPKELLLRVDQLIE